MTTSFAKHEAERLTALHQLRLLDTPDEAAFDRITSLAATLFEVPVALVSLIDENRQWFKSCYGEERIGGRESGRDIAFCTRAVEDDSMLVVPDAILDARFANNPLVTGAPHIRFYAGALIKSHQGFNLGTLCLIDFAPREFSDKERVLLQKLADMVSEEIERRREEKDARQSENRLRTLVSSTSDIISIVDAQGVFLYESAAVEPTLGYKPEEMIGRNAFEFIHPDDAAAVSASLGRNVDDPSYDAAIAFRFRHRDGSWHTLESVGRNRLDDADIAGVVISSRDITERQQTQKALRDSEEQLRLAVEAGQMGVWRTDWEQKTAFWSPRLEAMHGLPEGGFDGNLSSFLDLVHPNDRSAIQIGSPKSMTPRSEFCIEYRTIWPDGTLHWIESRAVPVFDSVGKPLSVLGVSVDITERKEAEAELRAEAARLAALSEAQNDIAVADLDLAHVKERITQRVMALTRAEGVAIMRVQGDQLVAVAGTGFSAPLIGTHIPLHGSLSGQSILENCVLRCDDTETETDLSIDRPACRRDGVRSMLAAPLRHHEETAWVLLMMSSRPHAFTERDEQTVDLLRGLCASVLGRTLEEEAKRAAQTALAESEKLKAAIVETALDCVVSIDNDGRVLEWNPAAERTFGYSHQEAVGVLLCQLILPPELQQTYRNAFVNHLEKRDSLNPDGRVELPAVRADGQRLTVEVAIVPIPDALPPVFIGHLRDITQRKQGEIELQNAMSEAERQREIADAANLAKSEFLSRMSHELRTPLNAILGFGQLLEMAELVEEDNQSVGQIVRAGRHLLELINEVLDIARIESGQLSLSLEAVSLSDAALQSLDLVRSLALQKGIELDGSSLSGCSSFVLADLQRFKQILLNLLANAIKYNHDGGKVTLSWKEIEGRRLHLSVIDNGPGVASEKMSRLFTPFDRLGAESGAVEGTGIGLALCKRLTELMNGTIGASSEVGAGSTFWVEFPLTEGPQQILETETKIDEENRAITTRWVVLYIEDNLSNLQLLQRVLQRRPEIKLLSAMQGNTGLELAQQHHPHLILLDLHLPEMDGAEVLRHLKADPSTRDIPVIVLSADATPHQIERLLKNGARAYLTKPFDIREFMQLLNDNLPSENLVSPNDIAPGKWSICSEKISHFGRHH